MKLSAILFGLMFLFIFANVNASRKLELERLLSGKPKYSASVLQSNSSNSSFIVSIQVIVFDVLTVHFCAGAIINQKWVVTVANCLKSDDPRMYSILAGTQNFILHEAIGQRRDVVRVIPNQLYTRDLKSVNDVGLIEVAAAFTFNSMVNRVKLPGQGIKLPPIDNAVLFTMSKRTLQDADAADIRLKITPFEIADLSECGTFFPFNNSGSVSVPSNLCTFSGKIVQTCCDSGSPVVQKSMNGDVFLVGLASWGDTECGGMRYVPTVFTRISAHNKWITRNLKFW